MTQGELMYSAAAVDPAIITNLRYRRAIRNHLREALRRAHCIYVTFHRPEFVPEHVQEDGTLIEDHYQIKATGRQSDESHMHELFVGPVQ